MSIHPSLRTSRAAGVARNVMKRHERVRHLMEQGLWPDGRSVLGLPKIKQTKIKSRKPAKEEKAAEAAAGTTAAATPAPAAKPASK